MIDTVFNGFRHGFLNLLFPPQCLLCRTPLFPCPAEPPEILCAGCLADIPLNTPPFCRRCSHPLPTGLDDFCLTCCKRDPHFDRAWSACLYEGVLPRLIHLFKYGQKTGLRKPFAGLMKNFLNSYHIHLQECDLIIPVPLHAVRFRERGYNQAYLLSDLLGEYLNVPVQTQALLRCRPTAFQARLAQKERWTNISGAFKIKHSQGLRNRTILLVDDLLTTGATVSEAAGVLKSAGARKVYVLTLAIAVEEIPVSTSNRK